MDVNTLAKRVIADYKADQEVQYGIRAVFSVVGDTAPKLAERVLELDAENERLRAAVNAMRAEAVGMVGAVLDMPIKTGDKDEILAALWAIEEHADGARAAADG